MKPQLVAVTLGAVAGIFAGRELEVGAIAMFGLVIVGMFVGLFLLRLFTRRSTA